jgi:hypothetical protein
MQEKKSKNNIKYVGFLAECGLPIVSLTSAPPIFSGTQFVKWSGTVL